MINNFAKPSSLNRDYDFPTIKYSIVRQSSNTPIGEVHTDSNNDIFGSTSILYRSTNSETEKIEELRDYAELNHGNLGDFILKDFNRNFDVGHTAELEKFEDL